MTKQEAIDILADVLADGFVIGDQCLELESEEETALKLAITALQDGVIPPCKIGDTVYSNRRLQGYYMRAKDAPYHYTVCFIGINNSEAFGGGFVNVLHKNGSMLQFKFGDFGKSVFLTAEEVVDI